MKRILLLTGILAATFILLSSFVLLMDPEYPPNGKKHINIIKIDDDGNKTELDTIVSEEEVFIWNGDTIGGKNGHKWFAKDFNLDSLNNEMDFDFDFDFEVDEDGEKKVFVMKSGTKGEPFVFNFNGLDSLKDIHVLKKDIDKALSNIEIWKDGKGTEFFLHDLPHPPHVMHIERKKSGNTIDLNEPGIISYKRKKKSGGREKITIIREIPDEEAESFSIEKIIEDDGKDVEIRVKKTE